MTRPRSILEAVLQFIARGWAPVPIPFKQKAPRLAAWQSLRITATSAPQYFGEEPMNAGLLLGDPSDGLVDVDLDCMEAVQLAPYFLPPTPAIFGRESKPASHYLYCVHSLKTVKFSADGMIVEVRSTGAQTVAPPSVHPSGESVRWDSDGVPAVVDAPHLLRCASHLAAAALALQLWPTEGTRHDTALALTGAALRWGWSAEDWTPILRLLLEHGGCDDVDQELRCVADTERAIREHRGVAGEAKLTEYWGEATVRRLKKWLSAAPLCSRPTPSTSMVLLPCTDDGNGERLVQTYGADLRYVPTWGQWLIWDLSRWQRDQRLKLKHFASLVAKSIAAEADRVDNLKEHGARVKWGIASQSRPRLEAMVSLAQPRLVVTPGELDQHPLLLNVSNGTLDLERFLLIPHERSHYFTKLAPVAYEPTAECPRWLAFLRQIMRDREELVQYLQRVFGYALTGNTREQCFFVLHGKGANGKSTLLDVLLHLLGDYARPTEARTLLVRSNSDGVRNDLAALFGLRAVTASEVPRGAKFDEAMVKQLTGGDKITARYLFQEYFDFVPWFKIFLAVNHKPAIQGTDEGIWRRIRLIPFDVVIPPDERDHQLGVKLWAELPGILAWAVEGCRLWQREGLGNPQAVREATERYRAESDTFGEFLAICCKYSPAGNGYVLAAELYRAYSQWAEGSGVEVLKKNEFGKVMSERNLPSTTKRVDGNTQRVYCSLVLREEWQRAARPPGTPPPERDSY